MTNKTIKAYKEAKEKIDEGINQFDDFNYFQTQKQTSETALKEMRDILKEEYDFLKGSYLYTGERIRLEYIEQKLNKINEVLEGKE